MIAPALLKVVAASLIAFGQPHAASMVAAVERDTAASCAEQLEKPSRDSVQNYLWISVRGPNRLGELPASYDTLIEEGIRQSFTFPRVLSLSAYRSLEGGTAFLTVEGYYTVTLSWDGTLSNAAVVGGTSDDSFDLAVLQALKTLNDSSLLPPIPEHARRDSVRLIVVIANGREDENGIPFRAFKVPARSGVTPVSTHGSQPQPKYPEDDRDAWRGGSVQMRAVIREDGTVDPRTPAVVTATRRSFALSADRAFRNMRFNPMRIGDCPVRAWTELPFEFAFDPRIPLDSTRKISH
jgi:hypothetical protein